MTTGTAKKRRREIPFAEFAGEIALILPPLYHLANAQVCVSVVSNAGCDCCLSILIGTTPGWQWFPALPPASPTPSGTQKYVCVKCLRQWQDNLLSGKNKNDGMGTSQGSAGCGPHHDASSLSPTCCSNTVRAFRCNVCCARFSLQPRMYGASVSLMQWLRAAGGALWLAMLAFGLSSTRGWAWWGLHTHIHRE